MAKRTKNWSKVSSHVVLEAFRNGLIPKSHPAVAAAKVKEAEQEKRDAVADKLYEEVNRLDDKCYTAEEKYNGLADDLHSYTESLRDDERELAVTMKHIAKNRKRIAEITPKVNAAKKVYAEAQRSFEIADRAANKAEGGSRRKGKVKKGRKTMRYSGR